MCTTTIHTYTYTYTHTHTYIHTYILTHTHTYTHTYIHTHINERRKTYTDNAALLHLKPETNMLLFQKDKMLQKKTEYRFYNTITQLTYFEQNLMAFLPHSWWIEPGTCLQGGV